MNNGSTCKDLGKRAIVQNKWKEKYLDTETWW